LRVPSFLLQRVNVLSDLSKLVEAQILDGALDFFHTAHTPIVPTSLRSSRYAGPGMPGPYGWGAW